MPEYQPVSSAYIAAIQRSCCPDCRQNSIRSSKHDVRPSGRGTDTFECRKCGRVRTVVLSGDPMTSDAQGWLAGELKPPT